MNKKASLKKNYIYNLVYQLLLIILPIITIPYVSRVLLPEGVGQNSFCLSIVTYFTMFASLGFGIYGQRAISMAQDSKEKQSKLFWEIVICKSIPTLLSLIVHGILIATGAYGANAKLMIILSINIVAIMFDINFFFQGNENFKTLTIKNLLIKITGVIAIFLFVKQQSDLRLYVLINSLVIIISNLFMWISLKGYLQKVSIKELNPFIHLKPALKLFVPTIAISVYVVLDKFLIGVITKSNLENGYYEQAEKIVKIALTIITCYGTIMTPRNSYEYKNGNTEKLQQNIYQAFHYVWIIGVPIMFGIILVAGNLLPWFLGNEFIPAILLVIVLSPLILIMGISNVIGVQYLIPTEKDNKYTISLIAGAVVNLILNLILIKFIGALGACIATVFAELAISIVMLYFARKELEFKKIFKSVIKPLIAGLIMCAIVIPIALYLAPSVINSIIIICAGCLAYGVAILILRDEMVIGIIKQVLSKIKK